MAIQVTCTCGKTLRARDELAGRKARCPGCSAVLNIPAAPAEPVAESVHRSAPDGIPGLLPDENDSATPYGRPNTIAAMADDSELDHSEAYVPLEKVDNSPAVIAPRATRGQPASRPNYQTASARTAVAQPDWNRTASRPDDETLPTWQGPPKLHAPKKERSSGGGGGGFGTTNAGVIGGVLMMILAVVWFVAGLYADRVFIYPPIMFVLGMIAVGKGMLGG